MKNLLLDHMSPLPNVGVEYTYADFSVSADGGGLFLFVRNDAFDKVYGRKSNTGITSLPKLQLGENAYFVLVHSNDGLETKYELPAMDIFFPQFDMFPNGKVLIASTRCQRRGKDDFDLNGNIVDPASGNVCRILLGDGIQDLSVDCNGKIWASYFDEGVFGNLGWGPRGVEPIGASGLNCFDAAGNVLWEFPGRDIFDCYAMNVSQNAVYIYYHSDFPLCRIDNKYELKKWETQLRGCSTIVIGQHLAVFTGQYHDPLSRIYVSRFEEDALSEPAGASLSLPNGDEIQKGKLVGRGECLHFCNSDGWFRFNVDTLE